jgi:DNA-binding PadR family transcriptional regulator
MTDKNFLGEFEQMVLLAILRLDRDAYGTAIRREIEELTDRDVSRGSVYITVDRLEAKGYLASRLADPTPERGGRAKRYYRVTAAGRRALQLSRQVLMRLWSGVEEVLERS